MIKSILYIKNGYKTYDKNVCIEVLLPCAPNKNDLIYLTTKQILDLGNKAKKQFEFYNDFILSGDILTDFGGINIVDSVAYVPNSEYIHIELI